MNYGMCNAPWKDSRLEPSQGQERETVSVSYTSHTLTSHTQCLAQQCYMY